MKSCIVSSADHAASLALNEAMIASNQGSFAVGGVLFVSKTRKIIKTMHNNVLVPLQNNHVFIRDPTAHGELLLVDWYYKNKKKKKLPEPEELTLVTSLDPCVMCSGALLTAGFNVGVIAMDDFAGINYNSKFNFPNLPKNLKRNIKNKFGYYATGNIRNDPSKYVRKYRGQKLLQFNSDRVSAQYIMGCGTIFAESVDHVRNISNQYSGKNPSEMKDPYNLPNNSRIKKKYRDIYSNAFFIKTNNSRFPSKSIIKELESVANNSSGHGNAVALIDPFGNLVLCMSGKEKISPIRTAFMEVVQNYSKTRWDLMNDAKSRNLAEDTLTHPKYGTFLFLYAPDPNDSTTLMTLGAYGSTMEGGVPQIFPTNLQYVKPTRKGKMLDLITNISKLPPFYTTLVQLSISKTTITGNEI